jgi:rod shape-determining protein MreD
MPGPLIGSPLALAATLMVALLSLTAAEFGSGETAFVSHLALAPLFMASIAERHRIGPLGAFATGLVVDVLTLAPLGVCTAGYLAFHVIVARESAVMRDVPLIVRWLFFIPLAGAVATVHIAAMVLVAAVEPLDLEVGISIAASALSYPALSCLTELFARRRVAAQKPLKG